MTKVTVSPSILSCDFANIEFELKALEGIGDLWVHLDIMDGHFVNNLTFGIPVVKRIAQISTHKLDAHLMVTNPEFHIEKMATFGLHNITFHHEAVTDPMPLIERAKGSYPSVGLSIKPETSVEQLSDEILRALDLVLVMSVGPGHGGQSFIPSSLEKISVLKGRRERLGADFTIQVDGGINSETAEECLARGVDNLVAGSYIFGASFEDYSKRVESLRITRDRRS